MLIYRSFGRKTQLFGNFKKIFSRKLRKMHDFSIGFKRFYEVCAKFSRVWTKSANCWEILRNFLKIFDENSIEKLNFYFILFLFWKIC